MGEITVTWKRDRHNGREDSRMEEKNTARDAINMYKKAATWAKSRHIVQEGRPWFRFPLSLNGKIIKCAIRYKIYQ